ncbi:MAG: ADP-forming succinate--CoA ligase subunit beta [Burkholderiales bacterium]|nr:ADP-forming succinate--CoA ligase subunit beta [Burkholderiales bacterium]
MNIHEYQAKEILRKYGVAVLNGRLITSADQASSAAEAMGGPVWVVKAQIHAGGRGKGGGVKLARSVDEVQQRAAEMIGMRLVTHQTGPEGRIVKKLYIEEGCDIAKEMYMGIVLDRGTGQVTMMASNEGGVEIEEVAMKHPEKILLEHVDASVGFRSFQGRNLAFALGLTGDAATSFAKFAEGLMKVYYDTDCSLVEINPLVVTKQGKVIALDAKFNFDDNAMFRHKDIAALRDLDEEDPKETEASNTGLSYIALDGNIGCMVNGAGLAMATMDIIKLFGGEPANFLDVGGGATKEMVTKAFKIILSDKAVKGIFINIFGGIMRCDVIAEGVVAAARELKLEVPVVVRLEGTNVEIGKKILSDSGLALTPADSMADGAKKIVELVKGA